MYDSARDCFTEQQVAEQQALAAEAAARAENAPRRRISTVGDLLSPVEDDATASSPSIHPLVKNSSTNMSGSPEVSSATLSPDTPHHKNAASPGLGKRRERVASPSNDERRKRIAPNERDHNRERGGDRDRRHDRDNRDRYQGRNRDRNQDHGRDDSGKRRRDGGSPPPRERNDVTLNADTPHHKDNAGSPSSGKKRERVASPPTDERRKRPALGDRDRDRDHHRDRHQDRSRDEDDNRKRHRAGGSASSPGDRNVYAPRRRSRSRSPRGDVSRQPYQRRPVSPGGRYRYRSPPPPLIARRDPSPSVPPPLEHESRSRETSPPRQRKLPGRSARLTESEKEAMRIAAEKKEAEAARLAKESVQARGVNEIVKAHYNDKRELGKTWRETHSQIKGLRSFNNWVKSTIIQKFSPNDGFDPRKPPPPGRGHENRIFVLDMGCGKGGDLLKWKSAPQEVELYVGVDTANISIDDARERYNQMVRGSRNRRGWGGNKPIFNAQFYAMDCWSNWIGDLPIVSEVGVDPNVGPGNTDRSHARWGKGGGFDVVTMMFCMHYAFESESKCRVMLKNVSGALKKGGRFIGTIPSSDVISSRVQGKHLDEAGQKELEEKEFGVREWGNSKYRVRFAEEPPKTGVFRPPWGWRYSYFLEEAVEEVPEYVVPWEAFRAIAEDYSLELIYKKPFHDIWKEEKDEPELKVLSERMGVVGRDGKFALDAEQWDACGFYLGFAFRKI